MLNKIRKLIEPLTTKIGFTAAKTHIPPSGWTALSLIAALASSYFYALEDSNATVYAGVMLLLSGFLDVVDGAVARATNRVSNIGAFLDSSLDRLSEVVVFTGVLLGGYAPPLPCVIGTIFLAACKLLQS